MKHCLCLAGAIFAAVIGTAQELPLRAIKVDKVVIIGTEWNRPIMGQVRCDDQGRTYFREYDRTQLTAPPVVMVNPSGNGVTRFSVRSEPSMQNATLSDFALSKEGRLFQFARLANESYVVSFGNDGQVLSRVKLERPLYVGHAVAFSDGTFLVTGSEPDGEGATKHIPFTGIVTTSGKLISRVLDEKMNQLPSASPENAEGSTSEPASTVLLGSAEAGSDGLAYVFRRASPVRVYVLNSQGEIVRTLEIEQPGDEHLKPNAMHVAHGQVALLFVEDSEQPNPAAVLLIADATTGETLRKYDAAPAGLAFACFTGDTAAFLGSTDNNLSIKWFSLR